MTGQDAVNTAKAFHDVLNFDGVILTKLDGDTRGGAALTIKSVVSKPIKFVGIGEKLDALDVCGGSCPADTNANGTCDTEEVADCLGVLSGDAELDAIGDCVVVLTNLAELAGVRIEDCISTAYDEISKRTGKMINGTFVKDER